MRKLYAMSAAILVHNRYVHTAKLNLKETSLVRTVSNTTTVLGLRAHRGRPGELTPL